MPQETPLCVTMPVLGTGSETFIRKHVLDLLPGGTSVICLTRADRPAWDTDGPCLELSPNRAPLPTKLYSKLRFRYFRALNERAIQSFLKRHKVQVVLGEYLSFSLPILKAAKAAGCRIVPQGLGIDMSSELRDPMWQQKYRFYNEADALISVSQEGLRRLREIGVTQTPMHAVPCSVVPYPSLPVRTESDTVHIVSVGRLVGKKGPLLLLESFAKALNIYPDLKLSLIGDGPLKGDAQAFIDRNNLRDQVTLHGAKPADFVMAQLLESDLFALHSIVDPVNHDEEGLPVSILEAMGYGLPVVSTLHSGIPEAVVEGESGFLVPEGDTDAMADRFVKLAQSSKLRKQMGVNGYRRVSEQFTWEREKADLIRILQLSTESGKPTECHT
jgi:glycosyltransferase involved in cell wall biosynthesis